MLDSNHLRILERSLDAGMLRQRTIANNIANIDTPQFKSKHVVFEEMLQQEIGDQSSQQRLAAYRTSERHIPFGPLGNGVPMPQVISNPNVFVQNNGNDVDVEYEMNQLAKNQIWYNGLSQLTSGYFQKLRSVIEGGGR